MTVSTVAPKLNLHNRQSGLSRSSVIKIAALAASVLLTVLATVCVVVANSPRGTANLISARDSTESKVTRGATASSSKSEPFDCVKSVEKTADRSDLLASPASADGGSAVADAGASSKFGAFRRFCFGTTTRKVVFSAVVVLFVLLVAFLVLYFIVLPRIGGDFWSHGGGSSGSTGDGHGKQLPTLQQQAELEVSDLMATNPIKVYVDVFGLFTGLFSTIFLTIGCMCKRFQIKKAKGAGLFKRIFGKRRRAGIIVCLLILVMLVVVPPWLYYSGDETFWLTVYEMTAVWPSAPMAFAIILLASGIILLLFLCMALYFSWKCEDRLGRSMDRQFMYWTNHTAGNHLYGQDFEKTKKLFKIKLAVVLASIIGCCIGLAYALANPGDGRILCAATIPCLGVFVLAVFILFFNKIFKRVGKCDDIVKGCGGLPLQEYNQLVVH